MQSFHRQYFLVYAKTTNFITRIGLVAMRYIFDWKSWAEKSPHDVTDYLGQYLLECNVPFTGILGPQDVLGYDTIRHF